MEVRLQLGKCHVVSSDVCTWILPFYSSEAVKKGEKKTHGKIKIFLSRESIADRFSYFSIAEASEFLDISV